MAKRNFLSASVQSEKAEKTWQFLKTNASSLMSANGMSSGLKIKRWAFFVFLLSNAIIIQVPPRVLFKLPYQKNKKKPKVNKIFSFKKHVFIFIKLNLCPLLGGSVQMHKSERIYIYIYIVGLSCTVDG